MNTLTKLALGLMGQWPTRAALGADTPTRELPAPDLRGGRPLMQALARRRSQRDFSRKALAPRQLSALLWAAAGINRSKLGGRTAPSAMNAQEVLLYAAMPEGLFLYEPEGHRLRQVVHEDVRQVTGYQDFVDNAPLDLVYVADHARMKLVPAGRREAYAYAAAGAMAQNVYLYCASEGLATVVRAWFDAEALGRAMKLDSDQQVLLTQTLGGPARPATAASGASAGG